MTPSRLIQTKTSSGQPDSATSRFRVATPGASRIRLEKRRPWQVDGPASATFEATVSATGPWTGDSEDGLSDEQKRSVLAGGRAA